MERDLKAVMTWITKTIPQIIEKILAFFGISIELFPKDEA